MNSNKLSIPKYIKDIELTISTKLRHIKNTESASLENKQLHFDKVLKVYVEALSKLIENSKTFSSILENIKHAYENSLVIRDKRIAQFIIQDRVFGITTRKLQRDDKLEKLSEEKEELREKNLKMTLEIAKLRKDFAKLEEEKFSEYLNLMKERDARYTLYFENLGLHMKIKELDGSSVPYNDAYGDPVVLKMALDRCREQLSSTQANLQTMVDDYSDTVPRRNYDILDAKNDELYKKLKAIDEEIQTLRNNLKRITAQKRNVEEELFEVKERCSELERAGTPRPQWDLCSDFIGGGRDRWHQLSRGLSSRDALRVLLKELGPAAESDHLEHFDGLGTDPVIPPYLRYEGRVRNLRLSRREISVIINDIWISKLEQGRDMSMQDYVTKYFEDRYQQPSVRAEWAYNLCAGAEQMLDEPQVKLFWGVLHSHLSEHIYIGLRTQWLALKEQVYRHSKDKETITLDDFEKVAKSEFPLKSEVDIKNLLDVVRKQLKMKINNNEVNLDKLFYENVLNSSLESGIVRLTSIGSPPITLDSNVTGESWVSCREVHLCLPLRVFERRDVTNEEGFDRVELAKELYRQRQLAQDKYIREVIAELGGKHAANKPVDVENLKRAFAIVDPAIDHIRMERYIRWAFSDQNSDLKNISPIPLRTLARRLATGDIEQIGPRYRGSRRNKYK